MLPRLQMADMSRPIWCECQRLGFLPNAETGVMPRLALCRKTVSPEHVGRQNSATRIGPR